MAKTPFICFSESVFPNPAHTYSIEAAILNMALRVLNLPLGLSLSKPIHPSTSSGRTGILQNENCCNRSCLADALMIFIWRHMDCQNLRVEPLVPSHAFADALEVGIGDRAFIDKFPFADHNDAIGQGQ